MNSMFKGDPQGLSKYTRKIGLYSSKVYDFERSDKNNYSIDLCLQFW